MENARLERFLPTRQSLLSRLKNWDDQDSWREFFEAYWRLIYDFAVKAGLKDAEAQDVVQETILSVAKQMPGFRYDSKRGQFKGWLRQIARRRIIEHLRRSYRDASKKGVAGISETNEPDLEELPDPSSQALDELWEKEWEQHLADLALQRVKRRVRAEHYQIFELLVIQGWPAAKVAKALDQSLALVYVTRHRIQALLKKELKALRNTGG